MTHGQGRFRTVLVLASAYVTAVVAVAPLSTQRGSSYLRKDTDRIEARNESKQVNATPGDRGCPICKDPKKMGMMPPEITHVSGVGPSHDHPNVLYVVEDAQKQFALYAISETGELLTTYKLLGVDLPNWACFGEGCKGDWEALSISPCTVGASENCIFIADVGNSCMRKQSACSDKRPYNMYSVLRFPEPKETPKAGKTEILTGKRFWFRFPNGDGPWDVGTLMADPKGEMYIVTKVDEGPSGLYRIPEFTSTTDTVTLEFITNVKRPPPGIKHGLQSSEFFAGGSIRNGLGGMLDISLRTHTHIIHYVVHDSHKLKEVFAKEPCVVSLSDEKPEGFTWDDHDGKSYFSISEGAASGIYKGECELPRSTFNTTYAFSHRSA